MLQFQRAFQHCEVNDRVVLQSNCELFRKHATEPVHGLLSVRQVDGTIISLLSCSAWIGFDIGMIYSGRYTRGSRYNINMSF